jgi:plasmid stabilization system protein ParE
MNSYTVYISPQAKKDIDLIYDYISDKLSAPLTAQRYRNSIFATIDRLSYLGGALAVSRQGSLQRLYGHGVRTVTYKKVTIIYNLIDDMALVHRVMASSLIW